MFSGGLHDTCAQGKQMRVLHLDFKVFRISWLFLSNSSFPCVKFSRCGFFFKNRIFPEFLFFCLWVFLKAFSANELVCCPYNCLCLIVSFFLLPQRWLLPGSYGGLPSHSIRPLALPFFFPPLPTCCLATFSIAQWQSWTMVIQYSTA